MLGNPNPRTRHAIVIFLAGWSTLMLLQTLVPRTADRARSVDYDILVESVHEGRPFRGPGQEKLLTHPPVFPLVLAAGYSAADTVGLARSLAYRWFAAALLSMCGALVFLIAARWTQVLPATICAIAVMLHPFSFVATTTPLSGLLFTALLLAALHQVVVSFHEPPHAVRAARIGVITGLALLTRAIAILLPVVVGFWMVAHALRNTSATTLRSRLLVPTIYALTMAMTVSIWPAWTTMEFGQPTLLSNRGGRALRDGLSLNLKDFREPIKLSPRLQELQQRTDAVYTTLDAPSRYLAYLGSEARRDPIAVAELFFLKARRAWYGLDSQDARRERIGRIVSLGYVLPSLLAIWLLFRRHRSAPLSSSDLLVLGTLLSIVLLFWGMTTISASLARYMIPAYSLLPLVWAIAWAGRLRAEHTAAS